MTILPTGGSAVMAQRHEPPDSLDFFPTGPWATRALVEHVLSTIWPGMGRFSAWEPAAGEGHMAEVLREYFREVYASDVHDYGRGYPVGSFIGEGADHARCPFSPDFVVTNPPFKKAKEFIERALGEAMRGVAMLVRLAFVEGTDRYEAIFRRHPPTVIAQFVERCPMHRGEWKPDGDTMTAYAWLVWSVPAQRRSGSRFMWIPPGRRQALERPDDRERFAPAPEPMQLFGDGEPK